MVIGKRQNTLVEGIRGTGKTHILKMLKRYHLENFSTTRVLPVYVSLAEISEHMKKDADEFRVQLYARIVAGCIETLETNREHLSSEASIRRSSILAIWRCFGFADQPPALSLDQSISKIKEIANELLFQLSYNVTAKDLKSYVMRSSERGVSASSSARGTVGAAAAETAMDLKNLVSSTGSIEETVRILGSTLAHNNASDFILRFLQQIQIILDLQYTLILLDECSEASKSAQIEIFRFFKAIRGSTSLQSAKDDCAFFVGSVYPLAETYYPNRAEDGFSFEPGQDCGMEFIQWDETDTKTYLGFFEQMTLARAKSVLSFSGRIDDFVNHYFDQRRTFELAAYCASGIPRRFWEMTKRAYDAGTHKISAARLRIAIQEIVSEQILGHSSLLDEDHSTVQFIIKLITQKNEHTRANNKHHGGDVLAQGIYFSILPKNAERLKRLVMQGAVHDKSRMKSRQQSLRPHPVFALDSAIAFAFRAIPERGFEKVAMRDFPRSTLNGFASAASFEPPKSKGFDPLKPKGAKTETRSAKPSEGLRFFLNKSGSRFRQSAQPMVDRSEPKSVASRSNVRTGLLKALSNDGGGFVSVHDGGPDALVPKADMLKLVNQGIELGSAVEFVLIEGVAGRAATNVNFLERSEIRSDTNQLAQIRAFVEMKLSLNPIIDLARLSSELRNHFGDAIVGSGWAGFGKLSKLLLALGMEDTELDTTPPGVLRRTKVSHRE